MERPYVLRAPSLSQKLLNLKLATCSGVVGMFHRRLCFDWKRLWVNVPLSPSFSALSMELVSLVSMSWIWRLASSTPCHTHTSWFFLMKMSNRRTAATRRSQGS